MRTVENPTDLVWNEGPLPDPRDCADGTVIVWITDEKGELRWTGLAYPWGNDLNVLRWTASGGLGLGFEDWETVRWAWVREPSPGTHLCPVCDHPLREHRWDPNALYRGAPNDSPEWRFGEHVCREGCTCHMPYDPSCYV
jgi:hypothetical protein